MACKLGVYRYTVLAEFLVLFLSSLCWLYEINNVQSEQNICPQNDNGVSSKCSKWSKTIQTVRYKCIIHPIFLWDPPFFKGFSEVLLASSFSPFRSYNR